ncbi:36_t:CDS:1 [Cetraspora pellucida]|uniref:36_t:CDS:1 n=1 Tax=Cetraspora pellucida TaxID=1433469 RepID=A0A9N9K816_9GLOM|nr:36_t:CDS:1 [Cetraspora pellucida]
MGVFDVHSKQDLVTKLVSECKNKKELFVIYFKKNGYEFGEEFRQQ